MRTKAPLKRILVDDATGEVTGMELVSGEVVVGDHYVSAMPVDALKLLLPDRWKPVPFFRQLEELRGIPVINVHLWFDRKLRPYDGLVFSRPPLPLRLRRHVRMLRGVRVGHEIHARARLRAV